MDFTKKTEDRGRTNIQAQPEQWDIQVNESIKENTIEYKPGNHVVIRANSIDFALSLVNRGRDLIAKYSSRT